MFDVTVELFGLQVNLFAQIFGFAMLVFTAIGYLTRDRTYFILTLCGSVCCIFESLVLYAWSSAIAVFLVCVRNCFILFYGKKGQRVPTWICYAIIATVAVSGIVSTILEHDIWSILPPVLTIADSFFATLRPQRELKIALIPISFGYVLFNYHVGAYVGVVRQILVFIAGVVGLIKYTVYLKRKETVAAINCENKNSVTAINCENKKSVTALNGENNENNT